jgi:hypothetical protein
MIRLSFICCPASSSFWRCFLGYAGEGVQRAVL